MEKLKYWEIEIDGPDKTGKDLLCRYLCELSGWKLSINVRGIVSQMVYTKKFNRDYEYDMSHFNTNKYVVVLHGDEQDIAIRCKATNEPPYDIKGDKKLFLDAASRAQKYCKEVMVFNTSYYTPYQIAQHVLARLQVLEETN